MEPLSQDYSTMSQADIIKAIQEKTEELITARTAEINTEAEFVEKIAQDTETGGFWQEFVADPLAEVASEFTDAFGDAKSISEAKANFESLVHSLFDPSGILAQTSAGILDPTALDANRIISAPEQTASLIERVPNLGGAKSPLAAEACQRGVIQSVATAAASVVSGAISNVARAVKTVHSALGYLKSTIPDIGAALANVAVQNLDSLLVDQDALLDLIAGVTEDINELVASMDEDDYLTDHVRLIRTEQLRLKAANADLEATKAQLLQGGPLDDSRWGAAKDKISQSAKTLCGFDILIRNPVKQIKLYGHVVYLDYLVDLLERQSAITDGISDNISRFRTNFVTATTFDSLFAPVIDQIQCRVRKITEDMDATLGRNQFIKYVLKEKQWCLELLAIEAFMKFADKMDIEANLRNFTGQEAIDDAMESIENVLFDAELATTAHDTARVIEIARSYSIAVKRKASRNLPAAPIINQGLILIAQTKIAKDNNLGILSLTGEFTTKVITTAGLAVGAVSTLLNYSADRNITAFLSAISQGDIIQALQLDSLTASLESQLSSLTAQLTASLDAAAVSFSDLLTMTTEYQEEVRSITLVDNLQTGFAEDHLQDLTVNEKQKYEDLSIVVARVARDLGQTASAVASPTIVVPTRQ